MLERFYPLSDNWVPPELLIRKDQLMELRGCCDGKNFWICGGTGLGKSLTVRIFAEINEKVFLITFFDRSFLKGVRRFAMMHGIVPRSSDGPIETIMKVLRARSYGLRNVVLIFDETDKLGPYLKRDFPIYLHCLYDALMEEAGIFSISIVTTRSFTEAESIMPPTTTSRLKFHPLVFLPYKKGEIVLLLEQRLRFISGLEYEREALEFIGEKVSSIGGDFKKALELTRNSIRNGKLLKIYSESAWSAEKSGFWRLQLLELPFHAALLLACIVSEVMSVHSEIDEPSSLPVSWEGVRLRYYNDCKKLGHTPQREKMLYYWLDKLCLEGWVEKYTLPKSHEWNYMRKKGIFIKLNEKPGNLIPPIEGIDWKTPW